jgi:hypothetical protein
MGLVAKENGGSNYPIIEAGMHQAVCIAVYDLGTQYNEKWNKRARKCTIIWELPDLRIEVDKDGQRLNLPRIISKRYTLSLHEKAELRKDLQSWRGRTFTEKELEGFDVSKLLGINCMIQVIHQQSDGKTYANISSIVPIMKSMQQVKPESKTVLFDMDASMDIPEDAPQWVKDLIRASDEYQAYAKNGGAGYADTPPAGFDDAPPPTDDLPF